MTVAFNAIPASLRVPLFYAEFNAGQSPFSGYSRNVMIGHKTASGTAPAGFLINLGGSDPRTLFGNGSMLCDMAVHAREMDVLGEMWCLVVAEPGSSVAATGTITFANNATNSGTLARWVHGELVSIPYQSGDTPTILAARLAAAINAGYVKFNRALLFGVSASAAAGVVTLTYRHGGVVGNAIRIETDLEPGFTDPAGTTITHAVTLTGGTGALDLAASLALLGPQNAEWITGPWNSTTQLNATRDFLSDQGMGRWAPMQQLHGHYTAPMNDTLANLTAFGQTRNDRHATIMGGLNFPQAPWSIGASVNAAISFSKNLGRELSEATEIVRPLQTIVLRGIKPPKAAADRFNTQDRQSLYMNGIGSFFIDAANNVQIERTVTTERLNAFNQPDPTFLDLETLALSAYVGRYFRSRVEGTYPRHALLDDNPRNLQGVVTPRMARDLTIHTYGELCDAGICENRELFAQNVVVERSSDPNRLNAYLPIDVGNQLRVFAANIEVSTQRAA